MRISDWSSDVCSSDLERPVQAITLTSSIRAAVRARERQYELQRLLSELEQGNERFRLIVENARDYAIILSAPNDVLTAWMHGAAAVFGWTEEEMLGNTISRIFTPDDRANCIPVLGPHRD